MKVIVNHWAVRLSNRVPELMATVCLLAGFVVCGRILTGGAPASSSSPVEAATTRRVDSAAALVKERAAARKGLSAKVAGAGVR